jgi:RNA polymerase sigma-70 factor (ECF subfamily)
VSSFRSDDAAAIAASLARPEAFDELFRRHFGDVYRFAARHLGASDGEEVAAEAFARAFAHRARFDREGSARAWLFGICLNVVRDRQRSGARRGQAYARAYEPDEDGGDDGAAEAALDARNMREPLLAALARLRPAERDVLLLYALAGLSYAEVGEALALPPGTVRSHLFRARGALRAALAPAPDEDVPSAPELTGRGGPR